MARVDLDTYYKSLFKNNDILREQFREINRGHVISSKYYDVQFGKDSLIYRDKTHKLVIPIEHDISHMLVIHLHYLFENNECDIFPPVLQGKISEALKFLKVKHQFES